MERPEVLAVLFCKGGAGKPAFTMQLAREVDTLVVEVVNLTGEKA